MVLGSPCRTYAIYTTDSADDVTSLENDNTCVGDGGIRITISDGNAFRLHLCVNCFVVKAKCAGKIGIPYELLMLVFMNMENHSSFFEIPSPREKWQVGRFAIN